MANVKQDYQDKKLDVATNIGKQPIKCDTQFTDGQFVANVFSKLVGGISKRMTPSGSVENEGFELKGKLYYDNYKEAYNKGTGEEAAKAMNLSDKTVDCFNKMIEEENARNNASKPTNDNNGTGGGDGSMRINADGNPDNNGTASGNQNNNPTPNSNTQDNNPSGTPNSNTSGDSDNLPYLISDGEGGYIEAKPNFSEKDIDDINAQLAALFEIEIYDPLVLDLNKDDKISIINSDTYFDYDGDGVREAGYWAGETDGFLAIDRNSNGIIDNASELFGNFSPNENGEMAKNKKTKFANLNLLVA